MKRLTDLPGSSRWFMGGVVSYADALKVEVLEVPAELVRDAGAVSEEVARAMARGAVGLTGAEVGAAVTGIAGPGGGVPGKPVGTVWFAVAEPAGVHAQLRTFLGGREEVREAAVDHLLEMLTRCLSSGTRSRENAANPEDPGG